VLFVVLGADVEAKVAFIYLILMALRCIYVFFIRIN